MEKLDFVTLVIDTVDCIFQVRGLDVQYYYKLSEVDQHYPTLIINHSTV